MILFPQLPMGGEKPVDYVAVVPLDHQVFPVRHTLAGFRVNNVEAEESLIVRRYALDLAEEEITGQIDIDEMMKSRIDYHAPLADLTTIPGADYAEGMTYRKFG